jgi:hypothetical protein
MSRIATISFLLALLLVALGGCASGPTPDWVPTTMTPAERAEAECRNSPAVSEARVAHALSGRGKLFVDPEEDAMEACMALKGFKRS